MRLTVQGVAASRGRLSQSNCVRDRTEGCGPLRPLHARDRRGAGWQEPRRSSLNHTPLHRSLPKLAKARHGNVAPASLMATTRAHTEPSVLKWARESAGIAIADAAHQIGVKPEVLEAAESGRHQLTLRQVEVAARAYSRPIAALFMPEPIKEPSTSVRHRRLPGSPPLPWSPAMRALTRLVDQRQRDVVAMLEQVDEEPEWRRTSVVLKRVGAGDIEKLAQATRKLLHFPVDEQIAIPWGSPYVALNRWIDAVEDLGLIVTQNSTFELGESRGFVSPSEPVPVVVLNSGERFVPARIFSLLHELGHLMEQLFPTTHGVGSEGWCNSFAAAVAMPADTFRRLYASESRHASDVRMAIRAVARHFVISQTATALRAGEVGVITKAQVNETVAHLKASNADFEPPSSRRKGNYHNNNFARLGPTLTRLTFGALDIGQISQVEASRILATKVEHFDELRDRLAKRVVVA